MGFCDSCGDEYSGELPRIMNELCFQLEIRGVS